MAKEHKPNLYSYRFRLYPNKEQRILLSKHFGAIRFVYNHFLASRKDKYLASKKSSNYYGDCKLLTELKKKHLWMKEVYSQSLQFSLKCLDAAYNNFFAGRGKFPVFKKKQGHQSFRIPQNVKIGDNHLYIPKFLEGIKMVKHREVEGTIKFATISRNKVGQYHVSITVERDMPMLLPVDAEIGVDLGIKTLATCSDGKVYENIKPYRQLKRKLKMAQRRLSRKKKGSKNQERARRKLAKIHLKVKNIRTDHLHKTTTKIIRENQTVYLESLNVLGMMKNHCLAGAIADASFYEIRRQLEYKAGWYGRTVKYLDRWFPSSKTCSECGFIKQDLKLKDREWNCPRCGTHHDRDLNAARMILKQGKIEGKLPLERREVKRVDLEEIRLNYQSAKVETRSHSPLGGR
jgi:putative transposase